jgi:dienelactone hydrolase
MEVLSVVVAGRAFLPADHQVETVPFAAWDGGIVMGEERIAMSRTIVFFALIAAPQLFAQDLADPGNYQVARTTVNFDVPGDGLRTAYLYFPTLGGGAVDPSGGMYPGIVFGQGWLQNTVQYDSTLRHLASHGYVVLGYDGQTGLIPDQEKYVDGLRTSFDYLEQINAQSGAFQGLINTNAFGLAGHSMGGGVSLVEAATDSRVKAVVGLAPADTTTNPTAKNSIGNITAPIRLLVGSEDIVASLSGSTQPLYNNAQDPKQLLVLDGGGHFGYEDTTSTLDGSMPRAEQLGITRRELTTYFDFYLKEDESRWREVWGPDGPVSGSISSVQLDPGMTLTALSGVTQAGVPGQSTTYTVRLTNTSRWASTFDLFADDNAWQTTIDTPTTTVLQSGESTTFNVTVTPTAGAFNAQDRLLLSARSGHDGLTRQYTYLTTTTGEGTELVTASLENRSLVTLDTAGNQSVFKDASSGLVTPIDVKLDAAGNTYVADPILNHVVKFDGSGQMTDITAGSSVLFPTALAVDPLGNVFVSSYLNDQILRIAPDGSYSVFADGADGIYRPFGLTIDSMGNVYVASIEGRSILKIDAQGNTSIFADESDGLLTPIDVKIDAAGNIYVADVLRGLIFSFDTAGNGAVFADRDDGLFTPSGMMFDHAGNLFVSNYLNDTIVKLTEDGVGTVVADITDGIKSPFGLAETLAGLAQRSLSFAAVPEMSSLSLLAVAMGVGLIAARRPRRRSTTFTT